MCATGFFASLVIYSEIRRPPPQYKESCCCSASIFFYQPLRPTLILRLLTSYLHSSYHDGTVNARLAQDVRLGPPCPFAFFWISLLTRWHSVLLVLTGLSFLPQLRLLWLRRDSSGISPYYVLFNLISATEQFTFAFFFVVNNSEGSDAFVNRPPNSGDWLNLIQLALVWVLWLAM